MGLIVTSEPEARRAAELGFDFVVAKGHEAGGRVGEETTFVLLQRLVPLLGLPVYAWGGVGPATVAGCRVGGAAGAVLDWQLALARESSLPPALRRAVAAMDGSETTTVLCPGGGSFRLFARAATPARDQLAALSEKLAAEDSTDSEAWDRTISRLMSEPRISSRLWAIGQDAAFASHLAGEVSSVARLLDQFREPIAALERGELEADVLGPGAPLARSHGTAYPILQGPMTRVSDVPEFCAAVADAGGLPFLALALFREAQTRDLLTRTAALLAGRPWGVGILGFVDRELRAEQTTAVLAARPPFAIIAGGRPDQAAVLEAAGITTYLHVPSPDLLASFLEAGARRFVFEGRECGGHVGPRSSFVLWESMIRVLVQSGLPDAEMRKIHVAFAGGIHDATSGAMVAAIAQPLVKRGVNVGALLGTAYLFTEEIVSSNAIVSQFQEIARSCDQTILVESGPGHAIRCADTKYVRYFEARKVELMRAGRPQEEIREELEALNMGRLRIASKGIVRQPAAASGGDGLVRVDIRQQERDGMYMIGQVAALRRNICTIAEMHRDVSAGSAGRLATWTSLPAVPRIDVEPSAPPLEIAVVGLSCLVPGATTITELWDSIIQKRDLIAEIPPDRFDVDRWFDPDRGTRDKFNSRWGGFLAEVPFDPFKFGIPPAALRSIEPAQLLALEVVDRVLRDAGYHGRNPARARTGVIFGVSGGAADLGLKYGFRALLPHYFENPGALLWDQLPEWTEDSFAGILANVLAGRISNRFDLGGPNFTVDAACASSLAAVYLGCRELAAGTSDMMIVGGCDTVQNPFAYLCFSKSGALSPRGRSRAFDASADGIVISEGLAAVVLKRLADAERDGDRIYAVIRAVAGASDGRSKGLTAPRPEGQMLTLRRAYAQAGFGPETVGLFEAHGTGTAVGDATECRTLANLLADRGAAPQSAAVGSIKSMIGHTKSTAGVISLIKTSLALYHRVLPPTLHVERPNPKAGMDGGALYVNTELRPWIRNSHPRRAGVSSFGFGGTNFHAVLEGYEDQAGTPAREPAHRSRSAELVVLSGRSTADLAARLRGLAGDLKRAVAGGARLELADVAYTLFRRSPLAAAGPRAAIVATSIDQLQEKLAAAADGLEANESPRPEALLQRDSGPAWLGRGTPLAFLFPGQGAQYPNMLRELATEFAEVSSTFERADAILGGAYPRRLSELIFPPPAFSDQERLQAAEALKSTDVAQPALGASGLALLRLMAAFGVRPDLVGGHSYGELVALHAAGSLDEATLFQLSLARGQAMHRAAGGSPGADAGTMLAAHADRGEVLRAIEGCENVWVANHNSPRQTVISGSRSGIAGAARRLEAAGINTSAIAVACAFHSPIVAPAREQFEQALRQAEIRPPALPVYSNVTAAAHAADPDRIRELLSEQIVREVRFVDEVEALYEAGARVFVELGPGAVGARLVSQILGDRPHVSIGLQARGTGGLEPFLRGLAELVLHGVEVNLERLYEGRRLELLDLGNPSALAPPALPAHTWLVDGGSARPIGEPRKRALRATLVSPEEARNGANAAVQPAGNGHAPAAAHAGRSNGEPRHVANNGHDSAHSNGSARSHGASNEQASHGNGTHDDAVAHKNGANAHAAAHPGDSRLTTMTTAKLKNPAPSNGHSHPPDSAAPESRSQVVPNGQKTSNGSPPARVPDHPTGAPLQADLDAYADFQRTMRRFIRAQNSVLEAFFDRASSGGAGLDLGFGQAATVVPFAVNGHSEAQPAAQATPSVAIDIPPFMPQPVRNGSTHDETAAAPTPVQLQPVAPSLPPPTATVVTSGLGVAEAEHLLLEITSERTGYPAEMLGLDANLEAELGIDSIKRVEIIGAFRRRALPGLGEPPGWFMEEMSAAKTLRAILAGVAKLGAADGSAAASPVAPLLAAATVPGPSPADAEGMLLEITSERTGYPAEMLGLDANLEAELGIDSIKRVEIIGAFRRRALPGLGEPPGWFMEEMSAAKTLRAILAGVAKLGAADGSAAAHPVAPLVAAATVPGPSPADAEGMLLEITSERTGYPAEMLGLDANLEAELGIDSIKRVEIIGAFRRRALPGLGEPPGWFMEEMSAAKTLRAILAGVAKLGDQPSAASTTEVAAPVETRDHHAGMTLDACPRCVAEAFEEPQGADACSVLPEGVWILTDDGHGYAPMLAREIEQGGGRPVLLRDADLSTREAVARVVDPLRQEGIAGVIHLAPLRLRRASRALRPRTGPAA